MNKILLTFLLLTTNFAVFSQQDSIRTFHIDKESTQLYQGKDIQTQNWFFYIDNEGFAYLANLNIPVQEVKFWFEKHKSSQNIFKSKTLVGNNEVLFLSKENEPDVVLSFLFSAENTDLNLIGTEDGKNFFFSKINIQE